MTPEALKIREYILNSAISDGAKNEILPLLGVIDTPGIKDRILKILEIEGKSLELQEQFLNMDIDNPQGNIQPLAQNTSPIQTAPSAPVQPVVPQTNTEAENLAKVQAQMQQLQQASVA